MKDVIVGVEESREARDAVRFGSLFAEALGTELHVVTVAAFDAAALELPDEYVEQRRDHFDRLFEIVDEELDREYTPHRVGSSSPAAGLSEVAEEIDAGAIVIGSSQYGAIGRVLLGDVGARLTAGAHCPIIVTPRGFARREQLGISRIGVGYDGASESGAALEQAAKLARRLDASLELIGVVPLPLLSPSRVGISDPGFERLLLQELEMRLKTAARIEGVEVGCTLRTGDAADELVDAAGELDLLILGSRGYGPLGRVLMGGVSAKVMRQAPCPVMVIPRGD